MSSLLVFNSVYGLEIQSVMLVFLESLSLYFSLDRSPPPPLPCGNKYTVLAIYGPMIYTALYVRNAFDAGNLEGVGLSGNRDFFGPCEMALSQ
jgi:hypothetical protein